MAGEINDSIQRWPKNVGGFVADKDVRRARYPSTDTSESIQESPTRSPGGFVTGKGIRRVNYTSMDTSDSYSSRYSIDSQKPKLSPGTYLVQLPKDQIYRVPPPENAQRYEYLSTQKPNRSSCRRCCCYTLAALLVLLVLVALVVGILFLVFRPHKPQFSVSKVSAAGINLTSSSPISPLFKIKVRAQNVNGKLGLIYGEGTAAEIFYDGIELGNGEFPAFMQPAENLTLMVATLTGLRIQLTSSLRQELTESEKKGKVPFDMRIKAPVKFKLGSVTMWTMNVLVNCKITVDKLTASAIVLTEHCDTQDGLL
ncbi:unnamed protein product [Thlaspi arvense]|uniref:Late embryogenesis abundant protein LEA-2 subgroup domain-containing protein n=1 Tax=Thlaspi arvense TaxID=13288 RepID=A0AAU9SSH0_THLAR|nr:unnamed protein product [Thlaspi arvense]